MLTFDELRRDGVLNALTESFADPDPAHELLDAIEFPRSRRPVFKTASQFWRQVCVDVGNGLTAGGFERLLSEAAAILPHNPAFVPWGGSVGEPESSGGTLTWLHLSDLHCCHARTGWDAGSVLHALESDLRELRDEHGLRPDLIFFTGDAAFGELPGLPITDQLEEAKAFFEGARTLCEVPVENFFLVPDNHDVHRGEISAHNTEWLDARLATHGLDDIQRLVHGAGKDWRNIMNRLDAYRRFLEGAGYTHLLDDFDRLIYVHRRTIDGVDLAVVGLNSAWSCGRDGERGKLWLAGDWQIGTLEPQIRGAAITVGLVHHPLSWLTEVEDPVLQPIFERTFDFHLHGHEHQAWVTPVAGGNVRIAAGACSTGPTSPTATTSCVSISDAAAGRSGYAGTRRTAVPGSLTSSRTRQIPGAFGSSSPCAAWQTEARVQKIVVLREMLATGGI